MKAKSRAARQIITSEALRNFIKSSFKATHVDLRLSDWRFSKGGEVGGRSDEDPPGINYQIGRVIRGGKN